MSAARKNNDWVLPKPGAWPYHLRLIIKTVFLEDFRMFRPCAPAMALIPLLMAGAVFAEETVLPPEVQAGETPAAAAADSQAAEPVAATAAPAVIPVPDDHLPVAKRPNFFQLHPLTMPKMSMPKPDFAKFKPSAGYVGAGVFNDMLGLNGTVLTPNGVFYGRVGRFADNNEGVAFNAGWRHPLTAAVNENGYQLGLFAGQIIGDGLNGKAINRVGAGADLSYQWAGPHSLRVFSVGVGVGEPLTEGASRLRTKPTSFFSYTVSLKLF
ncbi:MAG TPA: hypothetical protein VFW49_07840 [Fluviicoccus sp.]|nr:hypothetical protein [Fluviicoccus sp.]